MSKDTKIIFSPENPEGKVVNLTEAEKTQRDLDGEQAILHRQQLEEKETKKASGKQKLLDLGLTEEEVKALIGV
ncbi:hypothetical protein HTVC034P_gp38 [Pelagibacter phage HTVC034P]|nr:hypothetical protein HTVC034P_gp38 [Pelagibacter phage HTVC034P]